VPTSASPCIGSSSTQAIEAGIPTYLIDSDDAKPKRLKKGDPRLE
jgi:hypothetical protein